MGWFYLGHGRAALERFAEALDPFQKALDCGLSETKVHFQLGYCAHRAGRHDLAVAPLSVVLRSEPAHQEARYWLGASLVLLERAEEADRVLSPLTESAGSWRHLSLFQRALARKRLGRTAESRADLLLVENEAADQELRTRARELLEDRPPSPTPAAPSSRKLSLSGFLKAGYDSNVPLLSETSLSRGSGEGSAFLAGFVSSELDILGDDLLRLRGSGLSQRHAEVPEADLIALLGEVESVWKADERLELGGFLHGEGYYLDDEALFNRSGVRGSIRGRLPAGVTLAADAAWMRKDFTRSDFDDLDSQEVGAHGELTWEPLAGLLVLGIGYRYLREDAEAEELDHEDHQGEFRATVRPHPDWELNVQAWLSRATYAAPDTLTLVTRRDWREGIRLSAAWACFRGASIVLEGDFERVNSTLKDFDSDRSTLSLGMDFRY